MADSFVRLSPEEVFSLAERATLVAAASGSQAEMSPAAGEPSPAAVALWGEIAAAQSAAEAGLTLPASYHAAVAQITELLAMQLDLPSFEEWLEAYRKDPAVYDRELVGFQGDGEAAGSD